MDPTRQQLEEAYQSLSNKRLESIVEAGSFSKVAVEAAIDELRSRGVIVSQQKIEIPDSPAESDTHASDPLPESALPESESEVDLVTVYRADNPFKANIVSNLLQSEGVFAYVWGQNLGVAHTFLSFAGGGMRVQVREDQLVQAKEIIVKYERGEYKLEGSE